jgi:hypothetical protein
MPEECVRGSLDDCNASWIVCRDNLKEAIAGREAAFRSVKVGSINTSIDLDDEIVRFLYVDEEGGGFYVEAHIDAPDRPECASQLMNALLLYGRKMLTGRPGWRVAEFIVSNMMFPAARYRM